MGRRSPSQGTGLVVFGGFTDAARLPTGIGSVYDQAGPGPGEPAPDEAGSTWRPAMSGAQSVGLQIATATRGGYAGVDGARVIVRVDGEVLERDWRGWNEPNLPTGWSAPQSGWGAANFDAPVAAVLPSGRIAVLASVTGSTTQGRSWIYDPRTGVWTDGLDWSTTSGIDGPLALAYDPGSQRLLAWTGNGAAGSATTQAFSSIDEGLTWQLYARGMWPVAMTTTQPRVAVDPDGREWLATHNSTQMASNDHGISWREVGPLTGGTAGIYVPIRTAGGWLIAYVDAATNRPTVRLLPAAGALASGSVPISVSTTAALRVVGCTDDDGIVYLMASGQIAPSTFAVYRSLDGGRTWETSFYALAWGNNASVVAELKSLVASGGQLHMLYRPDTGEAASIDGNVAVLTLGGWSQVEAGTGAVSPETIANRFTYGMSQVGGVFSGTLWIPYNVPNLMGWTETVSLGIVTLGSGQPGLSVACTAGQGRIWEWNSDNGSFALTAGEAVLIPTILSATLATIGTTNTGLFLRPFLGNAGSTQEFAPFIDIGRDGIQIRDGVTILATESVTLSTHATHIRWVLRQGAISVWYRREALDPVEVWHRIANDITISSTGASNDSGLRWGCGGGSAAAATWRFVGTQAGGAWLNGIDTAAQVALKSINGLRGLRWGHALPGAGGAGYPLPFASSTAEDIGRLSATGGPTHSGEIVRIPVAYRFGAENLDPLTSPKPRAVWKAASAATQQIIYALPTAAWQGGAVALLFDHLVASALSFELDNGLGGFDPPVVVALGLIADCRYTLVGRSISPRTGTGILDAYVGEGQWVGHWLKTSLPVGHAWRRIEGNSGGYWTDATNVQQVRVTLAAAGTEGGVNGTELLTGAGALRIGRGIHLHYPVLDFPRNRLRLTIVPPDTSDSAVAQAGLCMLGRVLAVGGKSDFGGSRTQQLTRTLTRTADGTPSMRRRGPPRQIWSLPYTGGILLEQLRSLAAGSDHLGISGGSPIGTIGDVAYTWFGAIEHLLASGQTPCAYVPRLPDADATISDATRWLYGLLGSDSVDTTHVTGIEGSNEAVRLSAPTIEELR